MSENEYLAAQEAKRLIDNLDEKLTQRDITIGQLHKEVDTLKAKVEAYENQSVPVSETDRLRVQVAELRDDKARRLQLINDHWAERRSLARQVDGMRVERDKKQTELNAARSQLVDLRTELETTQRALSTVKTTVGGLESQLRVKTAQLADTEKALVTERTRATLMEGGVQVFEDLTNSASYWSTKYYDLKQKLEALTK